MRVTTLTSSTSSLNVEVVETGTACGCSSENDLDSNGNPDNDGDGLCDDWEINGIDIDSDGIVDLRLYDIDQNGIIDIGERADPNHKDIYVEIDWMDLHEPLPLAMAMVISSFANAPAHLVNNPDGLPGIRLHLQVDERAVAHHSDFAFEPLCTLPAIGGIPDFDIVKSGSFGTSRERGNSNSVKILDAKKQAFHYALFIHNLLGLGATSGCAELPGNDFVVSLGGWSSTGGHRAGSADAQAATFMHEIGHNLNLRHGGGDDINCKPNY